jgi:hypothetical protein
MTKPEILCLPVISYCSIPEELTENHWISDFGCDCYVRYSIEIPEEGIDDELSNWIMENYDIDETKDVLIHIDY